MTDTGWKIIVAGLPQLEDVELPSQFRDNDASIAELVHLRNLNTASLRAHHVTPNAVETLKGLKRLVTLTVTAGADQELSRIAEVSQIEQLTLNFNTITPEAVADLGRLPNLSVLNLGDSESIGDTHLEAVAATLPRLTTLNILQTSVTPAGVEACHEALPQCRIFWDGGTIEPETSATPADK